MTHPASQQKPMSLDDFEELLADQPEDERWELIDGRVVRMMVGARWEHNRIIGNLHYEIRRQLQASKSPCRVFTETFRLQKDSVRSSLLPDVIVSCRPLPPGATSLDDPVVVIEVLSDGTSRRDREEKWAVYRRLPSLMHYALVARDVPRAEIYDRSGDAWATYRLSEGLDAEIVFPALGVTVSLAKVYQDIFE